MEIFRDEYKKALDEFINFKKDQKKYRTSQTHLNV